MSPYRIETILPVLRSTLVAMALAVGLTACATPRYQTVYRLEPPADAAGLACLEKCSAQLAACQAQCAQTWQACVQSVEPLVQERYAQALQRYEEALDRYAAELRSYELQIWLDWRHGGWWYDPWPGPRWYPYPPPRKPSREAVMSQLRKDRCVEDCGCLGGHEACFLACGGRKIPEVRCVANCPPEAR